MYNKAAVRYTQKKMFTKVSQKSIYKQVYKWRDRCVCDIRFLFLFFTVEIEKF